MSAIDPRELALRVPDEPLWIDFRGLLDSRCGGAWADDGGWAAVASDRELAVVVGRPGPMVMAALERAPEVLTPLDDADWLAPRLGRVERGEAVLHVREARPGAPAKSGGAGIEVRLVAPSEPFSAPDFSPELTREWAVSQAAGWPLAVAFDGDRPVAVCNSAFETAHYWDVSLDTLTGYRRRGLAVATFECLAAEMAGSGKQPVWGAEIGNAASLALAARLGFHPIGRLVVFERCPASELGAKAGE